ncbi:DUF3369 domain-containing protein [Terrihabitans sp. PJ23]|uniref:histidine kinase n=2 Tax=Terrihabitans rhizophilus TaxID=3092662 RepID=A0ABU4RNP6_9HYPH|nr:DUF3369 domain-containing protein [Terrihabitans sp. PJ23]MDX6806465.1 DUF3369 domain-containing protein [Terrihabitans sp. PJ23]
MIVGLRLRGAEMGEAEFVTLIEDGDGPAPSVGLLPPWKIAVVDDDPAVHSATRFVLSEFSLNGRGLELLAAHTAAEARDLLRAHRDVAILLLDVVMETDNAGLDFVEFVRRDLGNEIVRIILRTGQPGQAPEQRVIVDYDINDYKAKTELTADKMFTTITAALRSYEQLKKLVETRRGLEIIIDAAPTLFDFNSMQRLAEGVLTQLATLIDAECVGILVVREQASDKGFLVLAGSGCYSDMANLRHEGLEEDLRALIDSGFCGRKHVFSDGRSVLYVGTGTGRELVVLLESGRSLSDTDRALVGVFCARLSIAFDNVALYQRLQDANAGLERRVAERTRDLSEANGRLQEQWARLRDANAFKNEILGVIAHDLKNPLSVVQGRAEILSEIIEMSPVPVQRAHDQIGHIRDAVRGLVGMVDQLIADALLEAQAMTLRPARFDLTALAREVLETNRPGAERKQQDMRMLPADPCAVLGDPDRLREALDNLVSNAIKYSPVGGRIVLEVDRGTSDAVVRITDSGPGLSPEDTERLFGRFQRLSAKPTAGESSSGLGLSIVKRIVDLHHGRIVAGSAHAGTGACFTMILPLEGPPA